MSESAVFWTHGPMEVVVGAWDRLWSILHPYFDCYHPLFRSILLCIIINITCVYRKSLSTIPCLLLGVSCCGYIWLTSQLASAKVLHGSCSPLSTSGISQKESWRMPFGVGEMAPNFGISATKSGNMMEHPWLRTRIRGSLGMQSVTHGSLPTCRFRILASRQPVNIHVFWENEVSLNQSGGLNMRQMVVCLLTTINQRSRHSPLSMYINVWPTIAIQWTRVDQTCWSRYMYYSGYAQLYKQHNIIGDGVLHGGSPSRVKPWLWKPLPGMPAAPLRALGYTSAGGCFATIGKNGHSSWRKLIYVDLKTDPYMGMDQYLLIPFLGGWTSIYQLFWCSPGVQGFDTLPHGLVTSKMGALKSSVAL